ncbi:3-oxo-tetronate kinase [Sneathiella sp. HT1-7]|uniref:3-oxo-tetronate kinase n=1 Tax=Sneathiella sp. HT1-7 TaxID=2887192 RepID=UPI001D139F22|nr:3-oxo-tetronate kinase [Sneathiella sp. HT1-7]MCC3306333.1 four-carbon acid sugar kinase family protein [Sneathiella sp. HT1-7]
MSIVLGCIADDLTGATDLAMILMREGMKTVQIIDVPDEMTSIPEADAVVVALKSRTIPATEAVEQSLAACEWLLKAGAKQIFFKYCSTFDSTDDGNIGPVTDALMDYLKCPYTIACPSFPENGRTVYKGHLFVNGTLLSESSLRNHPLTPMTDSNLNRVLSKQSASQISNIYVESIELGTDKIRNIFDNHDPGQKTIFVMDGLNDDHLKSIDSACKDLKLITGGSAVAMGLPDNFRAKELLRTSHPDNPFDVPKGRTVILSGSCSEATLEQIDYAKSRMPALKINPQDILDDKPVLAQTLDWVSKNMVEDGPILIYTSAPPTEVKALQNKKDRVAVGSLIEETLGQLAPALQESGFTRFIVAGGETSGAVIHSLAIQALEIGPQIDPGVPWTLSHSGQPLALALKSGNFGAQDFFPKAAAQIHAMSTKPS